MFRAPLRVRFLQHCKDANYALRCFQRKGSLVWKHGMEYGRIIWYGMEYKMEDFLYGMEMEWKKIA